MPSDYIEENIDIFRPFQSNENDVVVLEDRIKIARNDKCWLGNIEIVAASCVLQRPIIIWQMDDAGFLGVRDGCVIDRGLVDSVPFTRPPVHIYYNGADHYEGVILYGSDHVETFNANVRAIVGCRFRLNNIIAEVSSIADKKSQCLIRDEMKNVLHLGWEEFADWIKTNSSDSIGASVLKAYIAIFASSKFTDKTDFFIRIPRDSGKLTIIIYNLSFFRRC